MNRWLSGFIDFGGYRTSRWISGEPGDFKGNMWTYLLGAAQFLPSSGTFTPFAQALFGIAHTTSGTYVLGHHQTDFTTTVGGGFDYRLSRRLSPRPIQADYLLTGFKEFVETSGRPTQNNVRLSTGVVFHF